MKSTLALIFLLAACVVWVSVRQSQVCAVCSAGVPTLESMLVPASSDPSPSVLPDTAPPAPEVWREMDAAARVDSARSRVLPRLREELAVRGVPLGAEVFLRGFKESRELELWLRAGDGGHADWMLFRTYPIHAQSGTLGPKLREGDGQTPEGVYAVTKSALNPASLYHFSFNIGYPNEFDRAHQRTGSAIMVHGSNVSIGCLAMSDAGIEEIYLLVAEALDHGQRSVPIHIFPFRMSDERMARAGNATDLSFWQDLKAVHDAFEVRRQVPRVDVVEGRYAAGPANL